MKEIIVSKNDAGQRLDKLLGKYLNQASAGFLYKMLRKKNIKLNGKKATGNEIVHLSDQIEIFLSDDTFARFSTVKLPSGKQSDVDVIENPYRNIPALRKDLIIYEDEHICLINKPQGLLSQKAVQTDISVNEMFISYLIQSGQITLDHLQTFHPSVCNRLDRNTSGLLIAGKSLKGLQEMARLLQTHDAHKYYWCVVRGSITEKQRISGYLYKDTKTNKVTVMKEKHADAKPILTEYRPIAAGDHCTLLEVLLVTGRTHQIRAHLASIGHPIYGDLKYGDHFVNDILFKQYHIKDQMLHARRIEFPEMSGELSDISGKCFAAEPPKHFQHFMNEVFTCQPGNQEV